MEPFSTIKVILDILKHLKEFNKGQEDKEKIDLSSIFQKLSVVENELKQLKQEQEIKEKLNLNKIQVKLKYVFNSHSIDDNLIAEFITQFIDNNIQIPISEKENLHFIFDRLTDENIDTIFNLFGLNKGWLFDKEDLYSYRNYYKDIFGLIDFVIDKYKKDETIQGYAVKNGTLDKENTEYQPIYLIFRTPIGKLYGWNQTIYRYYPISTDWKWNHWRSRYQIKSIFYLADKYSHFFNLNGINIKDKEQFELATSSNYCPHKLIQSNSTPYGWYPYDFATMESQNVNALEVDEIGNIHNYIVEQGYQDYFEDKTTLKALFGS